MFEKSGVIQSCGRLRAAVRTAALMLAGAGLLAACAVQPVVPARQAAPPPAVTAVRQTTHPGGVLADMESVLLERIGADKSGFALLEVNQAGLRWRLALADSATHTLDLQYYCWWGDEAGTLLGKRIVDAADRGVKVRLILDDLSTMLLDETHPQVRDGTFALLDSHPNIEIRVFNVWHERALLGRGLEMLHRLERLNHRMHNKLFVADNRATIVGGRNIGNEYFGLSAEFNFRDLDVVGIGPVARQASDVFDAFWNSPSVTPFSRIDSSGRFETFRKEFGPIRAELVAARSLGAFRIDSREWRRELSDLVRDMHAGTSRMHADAPDPEAKTHHMPQAIRALAGTAKKELLLTNAYIIPDPATIAQFGELAARDVRVRVLTNSLASHDVPAVNSHYKQWRGPLLDAGVELFELRHDAALQPRVADTPPTKAEFVGLHVKAMVIDRERVFIGSMNLDPRSAAINTEMGVVIEGSGLAGALAAIMDQDVAPENAWRVSRDATGALKWTAGDMTSTVQPARSLLQRIEDVIFMLFPRDLYQQCTSRQPF